jgi:putative ABC transport system permease protein
LTEAYTAFSLIAIIIAGVGLIGLTTYLLNRKLKEISIRKIFGSSITQIVKWVYSGYIPIILISTALAGIAGYYFLESWLNNFSYRIELKLIYFVLPPLLMTIILLITTGFQSVRASLTNPANYLREE